MPLPAPIDKFSSVDYRNVALFSVPPLATALIGSLALRNENLVKNQIVPGHVPRDFRLYLALNCVTTAPLGCASYMIWKNGGFDNLDNRCAHMLNGALVLTGLTMAPAFKLGGFKLFAANTGLLAVLALGTTVAFDRIERAAGALVLPFAAWAFYCAVNSMLILKSAGGSNDTKTAKTGETPPTSNKNSVYATRY